MRARSFEARRITDAVIRRRSTSRTYHPPQSPPSRNHGRPQSRDFQVRPLHPFPHRIHVLLRHQPRGTLHRPRLLAQGGSDPQDSLREGRNPVGAGEVEGEASGSARPEAGKRGTAPGRERVAVVVRYPFGFRRA